MKYSFAFILFICFQISLYAQTIEGVVKDSDDQPIVDAYVYLSQTKIHSHTDDLGYFRLNNAKLDDTLVVTYLGFQTIHKVVDALVLSESVNLVMTDGKLLLDQVQVTGSMRNAYQISNIDIQLNPVKSSQEILQKVPGLIIAQHAGGGKAEQIFLRGFDIDHGTDIAINVDGMPVNMVSHAHGQGYSDLHFLIPETVDEIEFGKGTYYVDVGNFGTAGYVNFTTKDRIDKSVLGAEYGRFDTRRLYGLIDLLGNVKNTSAYIASEYIYSDGPFESSQNFNRFNIMTKLVKSFEDKSKLTIQASIFDSKWDASGQIPQRLVDAGTISRFGAVDDTEGGFTSRINLSLNHLKPLVASNFVKTHLYMVKYDFQLFSNFTFYLENPEEGDQIMQSENRTIYGMQSQIFDSRYYENFIVNSQVGIGLRHDVVEDNQLSSTLNRQTIRERFSFGNVHETNMFAFASTEFDFGQWLIVPGIRFDFFSFEYVDFLQTLYSTRSKNASIISPKLNLIYNPNQRLQLYLKAGKGFHANDTRVAINDELQTIPSAYGLDLGSVWKPNSKVWLTAALWSLYLEQEFVYVGDAAIVEPSGETQRSGIELGLRIQLTDNLFLDSDATYTRARSIEEGVENGQNYIPLAPDLTIAGGVTYNTNKWSSALRYQFIKDRPANEDNSLVAEGYMIVEANTNYRFDRLTIGISVDNLFNTEWNQAQFATESRLQNEPMSVEEIHFTPGTPFFVKGRLAFNF